MSEFTFGTWTPATELTWNLTAVQMHIQSFEKESSLLSILRIYIL